LALSTRQLRKQRGKSSPSNMYGKPNPQSFLPLTTVQIDLESSDDDIQEIQQEISVLSTCASPFVTQYKTSFLRGYKLWIVMEYLGGGSCLDLVTTLRVACRSGSNISSSNLDPSMKPISPSSASNYSSASTTCIRKARSIETSKLPTFSSHSSAKSSLQTLVSPLNSRTSNHSVTHSLERPFGWHLK